MYNRKHIRERNKKRKKINKVTAKEGNNEGKKEERGKAKTSMGVI